MKAAGFRDISGKDIEAAGHQGTVNAIGAERLHQGDGAGIQGHAGGQAFQQVGR